MIAAVYSRPGGCLPAAAPRPLVDLGACAIGDRVSDVPLTMGVMTLAVFILPTLTMAWAIWLLVTPFLRWPSAAPDCWLSGAPGHITLVRFDGIDGSMKADLNYRWVPTSEARFWRPGGLEVRRCLEFAARWPNRWN